MSLENSKLLLTDSKELLSNIESIYQTSLTNKDIPEILPLRIKQFIDNIRSSLDYAAFKIFTNYCSQNIPQDKLLKIEPKVYFPTKDTIEKFNSNIDSIFIGLRTSRNDIVLLLENCQSFKTSSWLSNLNILSNNNKHRDLTPQTRTETKEIKVTSPVGSSVFWNPSAVTFGSGVLINGVPMNPKTQMPAYNSSNKVEIKTWVGFKFTDLDLLVLPTLNAIYNEALSVIEQLDKLI